MWWNEQKKKTKKNTNKHKTEIITKTQMWKKWNNIRNKFKNKM